LYYSKLYSHPDKQLADHLKNVATLSRNIINSKFIKNKRLMGDISYLIGAAHDFGKSTTAFQKMLITNKRTKKASHSFLSSLFGYFIVKDFLIKTDRIDELWYIPSVSWIVISRHHTNIGNIKEESRKLRDQKKIRLIKEQMEDIKHKKEEIENIYNEILVDFEDYDLDLNTFFEEFDVLVGEIYKKTRKLAREGGLRAYFEILFFYSVLLDSDKMDASGSKIPSRIGNLSKDLVDDYKAKRFRSIQRGSMDKLRERIYQEVNERLGEIDIKRDRILSINVPTGTGKTLTGFSFALGLRERLNNVFCFEPKIIYSLPFLSIIDQNASVIGEILSSDRFKRNSKIPSNLLLKHHHLADIEYRELRNNELNLLDINSSLILTEGWHSEVVITTFFQLFHSILTNKNRAARKFHNIVNSVILLDEIQSIPHKYWHLINMVLKHLAFEFNCYFILMTATKPLIFDDSEIKELVKDKELYFESFDRVVFNFNLNPLDFDSFKEMILEKIKKDDKDIMVVLNTVKSSQKLYCYLKKELCNDIKSRSCVDGDGICNFPGLELINMSTYILPRYRLKRIKRIRKDNKRKVIITTQLVEAGVDISVDVVYRDLAPLDAIIQTAGRCNRNYSGSKGEVNIVIVKDEKGNFLYQHVYDPFLIDSTKIILKDMKGEVSENDFVFRSAKKYYLLLKERGSFDESLNLIESLKCLNFQETSQFALIEKTRSMSIFVELDKKARSIREELDNIMQMDRFIRKSELMRLKIYINDFSLSINYGEDKGLNSLPMIGELEDFRYIPLENLEDFYLMDIGLTVKWQTNKLGCTK